MSLIFDGLRRRVADKKRSEGVFILEDGAEKVSDSPDESPSTGAAFLSEGYKETLTKPDSSCITVDYSAKQGQSKAVDSSPKGVQSGNDGPQNAPISSQNCAGQRQCNYGQRIEMLQKNIQKPTINFTIHRESRSTFLQSLKHLPGYCLIAAESVLTAPYKLLKFLCGAPLKSINFCFNTLASLAENIYGSLLNFCLWLGKNCLKICRLLATGAFHIALFPVKILNYLGSFFIKNLCFFKDCCAIAKEKFATTFSSLYQMCNSGFNKIISINLPASLIQNVTVFLIKSSVAAVFFYLAITFFYKKFYNKESIPENRSQPIKTSEELPPKRKPKHLYRDPLLVQQEKIRDALLALHIDTIQRHEDGTAYIITDNRRFCIGALLNDHPKIRLEKVGKRSLYFSDKYGQWYKRSIQNMLD
ncbi:MAG: hypothetical protein LBG09_00675 [Puniceicoccales bacterium]|jgi:hypothetical protein|nr:hypothetical protein [Puniceicoccales bacterium]